MQQRRKLRLQNRFESLPAIMRADSDRMQASLAQLAISAGFATFLSTFCLKCCRVSQPGLLRFEMPSLSGRRNQSVQVRGTHWLFLALSVVFCSAQWRWDLLARLQVADFSAVCIVDSALFRSGNGLCTCFPNYRVSELASLRSHTLRVAGPRLFMCVSRTRLFCPTTQCTARADPNILSAVPLNGPSAGGTVVTFTGTRTEL